MCVLSAGGLNESLLLQLGKLPRLAQGGGSEGDTDKDAGSDATDLGDLADVMDVS